MDYTKISYIGRDKYNGKLSILTEREASLIINHSQPISPSRIDVVCCVYNETIEKPKEIDFEARFNQEYSHELSETSKQKVETYKNRLKKAISENDIVMEDFCNEKIKELESEADV